MKEENMIINGVKVEFDFTSPADIARYKQAAEIKAEKAANIPEPTVPIDDPAFLDEYIEMLNQSLKIYGDFIDEVFGDGIANQLLGDNPSLTKILETDDAIEKAMEQQGKSLGEAMRKYTPNRATRRKKDK